MKKNLTARSVVIAVTILLCIYGIIGFPTSKAALTDNVQKNIRLGLDLKGGSHLVLEVQVQDAVKAEADTTMERLKEDLKKQNIQWAGMDRNDPQTVADADKIDIAIKGIPSTQTSEFRNIVSERFPTYVLTAVNSTDYTMRLKPTELIELKRDTVQPPWIRSATASTSSGWRRSRCSSTDAPAPTIRFWCSSPAWTIPAV